jgi:hypothetical protein
MNRQAANSILPVMQIGLNDPIDFRIAAADFELHSKSNT